MVLLPGCGCCQACSCPKLAPYAVEHNSTSSWDFRCTRPAYSSSESSNILTAQQSQCDAVRGYWYNENYVVVGSVNISSEVLFGGNFFPATATFATQTYGALGPFTYTSSKLGFRSTAVTRPYYNTNYNLNASGRCHELWIDCRITHGRSARCLVSGITTQTAQ